MATKTAVKPLSNYEFGAAIGVHHSMASRYKNGQRLPSADAIQRISDTYGVPLKTLMAARKEGKEAFGRLISIRIFERGLRP